MNIVTRLSIHDTDGELYAALVQIFGETNGDSTRWVEFQTTSGVCVNFFALRDEKQEEVAA